MIWRIYWASRTPTSKSHHISLNYTYCIVRLILCIHNYSLRLMSIIRIQINGHCENVWMKNIYYSIWLSLKRIFLKIHDWQCSITVMCITIRWCVRYLYSTGSSIWYFMCLWNEYVPILIRFESVHYDLYSFTVIYHIVSYKHD